MAEIRDMIREMSDYGLCSLNIVERNASFSCIKLLKEELGLSREECLYIGSVSQIGLLKKGSSGGIFLLVTDEGVLSDDFVKNNTVILAEMVQNVDTLYRHCCRWLSEYSKYLEASEQIFQTLLDFSDGSLQRLLNEAADILKNPLVVLDANCKILASSKSYEVEDEIWRQNLARGYCTYEQIIELQRLADEETPEKNKKCQVVSSSFYRNRMCINRLQTPEETLGMLIVFEVSTPFSKMDRKLLIRIAQLAAIVIHRNYERLRTLNEYSEDNIVIECLSGELKSYASYLERIRNTPFNEPSSYRIILIDVENFENFDPRKEILRSYFNKLFRRAWMLWYRGNVVAIVDVGDADDILAVLARGDAFFREKRLRLGISDVFKNIYYIEQYYRQGISALKLAERFGAKEYLLFYNDYKFYDMLQVIVDQPGAEAYLDCRLTDILEYDKKNNTEYYRTIEKYIFSGQNPARAAEELHVHKNTVSYRISKAKTLFSLSFDHVEEVFRLMYSYKIKQMMPSVSDEKRGAEQKKKYPYDFLC